MKTLLFVSLLTAFTSQALANGGGYTQGGVTESGTITGFVPEETDKVRILQEDLTIDLNSAEARVEVRYLLKNTSGKHVTVRFGFPVEELKEESPFAAPSEPTPSDEKKKKKKSPLQYCRDYQIEIGGKAIAADFESEPKNHGGDQRRIGLKGWLVSKASFAPGEEKPMRISYHSDWSLSSEWVSEDGHSSAKQFVYRLSTGACWDGPIEHGRVIVRSEGLDPAGVKVLKPAGRFHKSGNQWEWNFENLKPTLADDLTIQGAPIESSYGERSETGKFSPGGGPTVTFIERDGRWFIEHQNYRIKASSTLAPEGEHHYDADNLKRYDGVWSAGKSNDGIGESLEITPEVPKPLNAIKMSPGYTSSDALFKANARPHVMEIALNDDFRFSATLQDRAEAQSIPVTGYDKPVRKITITFKEAYPGSRHKDLCVTGLSLENRLNKKPQITPAR